MPARLRGTGVCARRVCYPRVIPTYLGHILQPAAPQVSCAKAKYLVEVEAHLSSDSGMAIRPALFAALEGITMQAVGEPEQDCTHMPRLCQ